MKWKAGAVCSLVAAGAGIWVVSFLSFVAGDVAPLEIWLGISLFAAVPAFIGGMISYWND